MSKTVTKKILPKYFRDVLDGHKTFELRKDEDDIQPGDTLVLKEWGPDKKSFTGRQVEKQVSYVLRKCTKYGLMDGYCIIGCANDSVDIEKEVSS